MIRGLTVHSLPPHAWTHRGTVHLHNRLLRFSTLKSATVSSGTFCTPDIRIKDLKHILLCIHHGQSFSLLAILSIHTGNFCVRHSMGVCSRILCPQANISTESLANETAPWKALILASLISTQNSLHGGGRGQHISFSVHARPVFLRLASSHKINTYPRGPTHMILKNCEIFTGLLNCWAALKKTLTLAWAKTILMTSLGPNPT